MKAIRTALVIKNLRIYAHHGVLPQEQRTGAYYIINLKAFVDFTPAMETDELTDTVSYADVFNTVKQEMQQSSLLLERVAGRICTSLLEHYPAITKVEISLLKENPPMGAECTGAGVEVTAERN